MASAPYVDPVSPISTQMTMADSKIAFNPLVNLASSDIDSDSHEYPIGDRPSSFSVA